jgi:hypothetical protein
MREKHYLLAEKVQLIRQANMAYIFLLISEHPIRHSMYTSESKQGRRKCQNGLAQSHITLTTWLLTRALWLPSSPMRHRDGSESGKGWAKYYPLTTTLVNMSADKISLSCSTGTTHEYPSGMFKRSNNRIIVIRNNISIVKQDTNTPILLT